MDSAYGDRFTTGEFAALCGVTKHTLFHYDALGVFTPAAVGENGYRYYTAAQLDVFHVISTLRELDMPLSEIRSYLDQRSPAALAELLEREEARLGERIARLRRLRALVRGRAALIRRAMEVDPAAVALSEERERLLVATAVPPLTSGRRLAESLAAHTRYCRAHGVESPHSTGSVLPRAAAEAGDFTGYTHFYTQVDRPPRVVEVLRAPAGRYLSACHTGGFAGVDEAYRRLLDAAAARSLPLGDRFFEDMVLDELSSAEEDYVIRVSIQVSEPSD